MIEFIAAVVLVVGLIVACTWSIQLIVTSLRTGGWVWTTIENLANRSIARSAAASLDREYEELLAREGRH